METAKYQLASKTRLLSIFSILLMLIGFVYVVLKVKDSFKTIELNNKTIQTQKITADSLDGVIESKKKILDEIALINSSKQANKQEQIQDKLITEKSLENAAISLKTNDKKAKVYIQVNTKALLEEVKSIKLIETITSDDFQALGYDLEEGRADNSIRYFHEEDKTKAEKLKALLENKTRYRLLLKPVRGFEKKVKVGQLEIWIK